uniref:DRBM domain-containing protein n=1 Tax=Branchiostoma floridae TaxID=7739 RepID=C3Z4J4_BRAFL|eukprot:XP_002596571.1 hypothetical protein BRAFLDRAFT_98319 [Branchiostoma floridae]
MADQQGLSNKDKVCQFFASNAGLHFRSADVAAALGLDGRSVGQQLARLWRAGFVEKVQTTPYATWRMKLHTYPGRNLHGPAAPKPAIQTPAKKSTRGSRSHEEVRNDSGHCPMGSPMIQGWREGDSEEGEEEVDQEGSLVDAPSVRIPASHSVSSKPPSSTRREATSSQENISGQKKAAESQTTKRKLGRPPGNKLSATTTAHDQVGLKGSTTLRFGQKTSCVATGLKRKVSSNSKNADQGKKGRSKSTTSQPALREDSSDRRYTDSESSSPNIVQKRKVGAETRKGNQGLKGKGKKRKSQHVLREDSSDRSSTDSESPSPKVVETVLKRKVGAKKTKENQGMKGIVKKTMSQTMDKDCNNRSGVGSESLSQVQNKTRLMPTTVSCQRTSTTAVKKNTDKGRKGTVIKKTMTQARDREGNASTSSRDSLQNKARLMPATLAPTLNKPAGNMETQLLNFIQEAQGMLVMTGNDVAKALGSKPKETHRLLLHMQRTGQVRKVCDKPTRWMMLGGGQGRGGLARKGQRQGLPGTKHQSMSIPASRNLHTSTVSAIQTSRNLHSGTATSTQTSRNLHSGTASFTETSRNLHTQTASSTQTSRILHTGTAIQTSRNPHIGTASSNQTSRNLHIGTATSTQTSRNLHIITATEEANSRTSHSVRAQSGDGLVEERQTFLTLPSKEEEEDDTEIAFTSTQWSTEPERCLTTEEEEDEDISCVSHEQESILLEDVEFCTKTNRSTSSSHQSLSKNKYMTGNQRSQGTSALRRSCGVFGRKTPVKKLVLSDRQKPARMSMKDGSSSNLTAATVKPSEGLPKQQSNQNEELGSCQANKGLSNFKIPKKNQVSNNDLRRTQITIQKSKDLHQGKDMSLSKDEQGSKTQRAAGTSKIPPHILKHSVSYFASATTEPNTTPKPRRAFKTTRNDRTEQDKSERPFVRATDGDVLEEPLIDIDVAVDLSLNKTQLKSGAHFCSSMCDNDRGLLHSPISSSIKTPPSRPPKLYPHIARESAREKRMVQMFGSCDSPPVLVKQGENIRRDSTEGPAFRAARRNLYPWLASETSKQHQQSSTSISSRPEQSLYNEDENRCFSSGLVENDASLTAGSAHGSQADADMEIEQKSKCCFAWNSNELENDRETAARLGGQEYVSGKRSFLPGSDCCKQSTCSLSLVEDVGTDPRRARGQGLYAELHGNSRVTSSEVIGQAGQRSGTLLHARGQSKDRTGQGTRSGSSLSSQDRLREGNVFGHCCSTAANSKMALSHGRGDVPSAEQLVCNTTTNSKMPLAHGRGAVPGAEELVCSTAANSKMAYTHCTGPVPGAKQFNSHPRSCCATVAALHTHHDEKEAARAKSEHGQRYVQMQSRVTAADVHVHCKNKSKNEDSNNTLTAENIHLCHDGNVTAGMRQYRKRDNAGRLLAQAIKSAVSPLNVPGGRKITCNIRDVKRTGDTSESMGHTVLQCRASQHVKSGSVLQPARESTCQSLRNETHQKQTGNKGQGNLHSFEAGKAVSSVSIGRMGSYVPRRQLRTTTVDNKVPVHHLGAVPSAEPLVGHPKGYPRTDPALIVCSVGNVEQAGHRPNSERLPKSESNYQVTENRNSACLEVPTPHDAATRSVCKHKEMSSRCKTDLEKERTKVSWPQQRKDYCSGQEDILPAKSRRISLGTEMTVPHTRATHTARNNDENLYKSDNASVPIEQISRAMMSKSQNHTTAMNTERTNAGNLSKSDNACFLGEQASQATLLETQSGRLYRICDVSRKSGKSTTGAKGVAPSLTREKNTKVSQDASQNAEELMSEKFLQNESARWQRPRSPKSFLTDYWSKAETKDAKHFVAENKTVNFRLLACPTTNAEISDSEEESPSDLSKNCSKSKICVNKVLFKDNANLTDEKCQIVLKEEPKTFCMTETQTSQEFVHTSQARTSKSIDHRYSLKNSPTKVQSDEEDVVVSLEERAGGQAVSSPIGPLEQSTWTQPKALYTSNKTEPVEQGETEADEETGGQEKSPVDEAKGHGGSEVSQVIIHQSSVARVTPQGGRQVATSDQPSGTLLQGHPIVQLNELCQRNRLRICFQDISVTGPAHRPRVQLAAVVGERAFQAEASSKKAARRQAARKALQALYREGYK